MSKIPILGRVWHAVAYQQWEALVCSIYVKMCVFWFEPVATNRPKSFQSRSSFLTVFTLLLRASCFIIWMENFLNHHLKAQELFSSFLSSCLLFNFLLALCIIASFHPTLGLLQLWDIQRHSLYWANMGLIGPATKKQLAFCCWVESYCLGVSTAVRVLSLNHESFILVRVCWIWKNYSWLIIQM